MGLSTQYEDWFGVGGSAQEPTVRIHRSDPIDFETLHVGERLLNQHHGFHPVTGIGYLVLPRGRKRGNNGYQVTEIFESLC